MKILVSHLYSIKNYPEYPEYLLLPGTYFDRFMHGVCYKERLRI